MDLGLLSIASLLGAGVLFNKKKQERETREDLKTTDHLPHVGETIYESADYYKGRDIEAQKAHDNFVKAKSPLETGVIPMYYNTLHVKTDAHKVPNSSYQQQLLYKVLEDLDPDTKRELEVKAGQFKTLSDSSRREILSTSGVINPDSHAHNAQGAHNAQSGLQVGGSLVPFYRGGKDFTHNNMVPFYKGSIKQPIDSSRMNDGKLELYTGQFKLNRAQKEESGPRFAPTVGLTNIHGMQEKRDLSRFVPSNLGKKSNESPIEKIQVGPGLDNGYTATPTGGFHPMVRIMPKKIEELRVDPVLEQKGRIVNGKSRIDKRGITSQVYNYKNKILIENKNGERNFTTVGSVHGRKLRPAILLKATNRTTSKQLIAPAKFVGAEGSRIAPKAAVSTKVNHFNTPFRNAFNTILAKVTDYGKSSFVNKMNNRAVTETRTHIPIAKGPQKLTPHLSDHLSPTIRQFTGKTDYLGGAVLPVKKRITVDSTPLKTTTKETTHFSHTGGATGEKRLKKRVGDKARTTIKETTHHDYTGAVGTVGLQNGRGYMSCNVTAPNTTKQFTSDHEYYSNAEAGHKKTRDYTSAYNANVNINKEKIAKGREPKGSCTKVGRQATHVVTKKQDEDRLNRRGQVKTSNELSYFNTGAHSTKTVTSVKNHLPQEDTRLDPSLLEPFVSNPLTQSLTSY